MSCEICGRSSCTRSFHSLAAQEAFDEEMKIMRESHDDVVYALKSLYALVKGECPSLLENDHHDEIVRDALFKATGEQP